MIDAARLLNDLDPPAFQQAIVALRAEAASLAAQPGSASPAPTPTANAAANQGGAAASTPAQPAASEPDRWSGPSVAAQLFRSGTIP